MRRFAAYTMVFAAMALAGCGNHVGKRPLPVDAGAKSKGAATKTSAISIQKLENGTVALSLADACDSTSNILFPEDTDMTIGAAEGPSHFVARKLSCTTQPEGSCQCTCPAGSNPMFMTAQLPKSANATVSYADIVFCSPVTP